jgi:transcriptional regulator with XRE-family HTH domain
VRVALETNQAVRLARALRDLRESTWPDQVLTQAQLAKALSSEGRVAAATLSSWESVTNPKTPSEARITAYARFFSTERSLEGGPHLIPEDQLTPAELKRYQELESQLLELFHPENRKVQRSFQFDVGPVVVICPDAPTNERGRLADERNLNFTRLQRYGDLDALIELYGHLRAENPGLDVFHRLASEVVSDDLSSHVILLGGIGWNEVTRSIQRAIKQVPITQTAVPDLESGEIFEVEDPKGNEKFYPEYEQDQRDVKRLMADVGYLARLRNPFKISRTLTICNGIHSRGVLGAVRCLTDKKVREENEKYLASRFPDGEFAMLLRVPVVSNQTMSPDLVNPIARLFEWAPNQDGRR